MKNIGAKLQTAREERGLSIEDIARETNISRRYIQALEAEDFSEFAAEAYILGFLKNYGEYLGLNVQELREQYKVLRIQEQPVPVNELLNKASKLPNALPILGIIIVCAGAALGVFYIIKKAGNVINMNAGVKKPFEYSLPSSGVLEQRLYNGDAVTIGTGDGASYRVELVGIGDAVNLSTPDGPVSIDRNKDAIIDISGSGASEVRFIVVDYERNKSAAGVQLRVELINNNSNNNAVFTEESQLQEASAEASAPPAQDARREKVVLDGERDPFAFTLKVSFQSNCMFRWEILREAGRGRNEDYFLRGREVEISAQNGIRIWMSNAGAARLQVIAGGRSKPLTAGPVGTIVVADLIWRRGADGRWNLVFVEN